MQISDSIVIIPTYNERENIENIIRAVFGLPKIFHILVIEDGSPDGTASPDSSGHWNIRTNIFLKWMLISVIIRMTCPVCIRRVRKQEEM